MSCPFIDQSMPRCSESLSMKHIDEAYELCGDHYQLCPVYLELSRAEVVSLGIEAAPGRSGTKTMPLPVR